MKYIDHEFNSGWKSITRSSQESSLLQPGVTCWRRAYASRIAMLIDNQAYFSMLMSSMERAEHSIMLVGWQLDPRTVLEPGDPRTDSDTRLGAILRRLAEQRRALEIRLLVWDMSWPMSITRAMYPHRARGWFDDRVQLLLDGDHPRGACRHQKLAIIDSSIAFCSGADLATNRWDSDMHLDRDPRRSLPSGRTHPPRHSLSVIFDGAAARAVDELCRARWAHFQGKQQGADGLHDAGRLWPNDLVPTFQDIEVGIARTEPEHRGRAPVREIESLLSSAIHAARKIIYIEDQYFASPALAKLISARLQEPHGPEVVVITSIRAASFFDRLIMDPARDTLVKALQAADPFARFGIYSPVTKGGHPILIHSKALIVDDRLLRIGSANLTNRSMGFDSECDVAIDTMSVPPACRHSVEEMIRQCRLTLLAHHMATSSVQLARSIERLGSVHVAIEHAAGDAHARLRRVRSRPPAGLKRIIARYQLGDPKSSADSWRPWRRPHG